MSDQMMPPKPGIAPPPDQSMFNPAGAGLMAMRGDLAGSQTVRDVLGKMGIDVDGPATQLVDLFKSQMQKRTLTGRMGMEVAPPQTGPALPLQGQRPMGPPPQAPGLESGGMEGLMRNLRR